MLRDVLASLPAGERLRAALLFPADRIGEASVTAAADIVRDSPYAIVVLSDQDSMKDAAINLLRPWLPLFVLGMIAAALGIVLYNVVLSGLAAALLILSLARPAAAATR